MVPTTRWVNCCRRSGWRLALPLAAALTVVVADRADAQFGIGFGFGIGPQTPASVEYLNQRSLISAQNAATNRQNSTFNMGGFANNPNSYVNRRREAALQERFSISDHSRLESRVSPGLATLDLRPRTIRMNPVTGAFEGPNGAPAQPAATDPAAATTEPAAATPPALAAFFNAYQELIWPADAPYHDEFKPLRETSDEASLRTLQEAETQGIASISTVAEARTSLLDYGRPALQYVREHSTSQIADGFHSFLLSLYGSLQQAALVPSSSSPAENR